MLALFLPACRQEDGTGQAPDLGNHFEASAERPYSFDYPSEWELGEESGGDLALGMGDDSVGMVLEPVHPWGGMGAFGRQDVERLEIDGYEAYRMRLGGGEQGKGVAYRINAGGTDVSVWFFAKGSAAYDEHLFEAIMNTFRFEERLLQE